MKLVFFLGEWYFDCTCRRCQDPTELETFVSALICEVCEDDFLLPTGYSFLLSHDKIFDLRTNCFQILFQVTCQYSSGILIGILQE